MFYAIVNNYNGDVSVYQAIIGGDLDHAVDYFLKADNFATLTNLGHNQADGLKSVEIIQSACDRVITEEKLCQIADASHEAMEREREEEKAMDERAEYERLKLKFEE